MLDIQLLRKDLDSVVARLQTRKNPQAFLNVEAFKALESERKSIQTRTEELQSKRNQLSKQIGMLMGKGEKDAAEAAKAEVAAMKTELEQSAARLEQIQTELQAMLVAVPNLPHESVPVGADEEGNVEVRRWGTPRTFDFEVKDHVDLGAPWAWTSNGRQALGARFTVMKGQIARLHRALAQFMLDLQTEAWLHRMLCALHRQQRLAQGHGPAAQVRRRPVCGQEGRPGRRAGARHRRAVPDSHAKCR
jgi:seryl-tRNA synthetase